MTTYLLDVNLFLALAWPNRVHHALAHSWLRQQADDRWATCPFTEAAFVRLSCNPRVVQRTLLPAQALDVLRRNTEAAAHVFWPDDLPFLEAVAPFRQQLAGHRQVTDAYLLGLACRRRGVLATFDQGLTALAPASSALHARLQVVPLL